MTVHCRRLIGEGRERKVSVEIHLECSRHIAAIGRNGNHKLSGCGIPVDWPLRIPINRIHCGNLTGTPSPTIKMQTHVATLTVTTPHRGQRTIAGIQAKRKHLIVPARQSHRPERLGFTDHRLHMLLVAFTPSCTQASCRSFMRFRSQTGRTALRMWC